MPLISHEIPKALFEKSTSINNYPYALGHLLNKDKEYTEYYRDQLRKANYSILDNSIFELGHSISFEELYDLGKEFKPTHLVLPDVLGDRDNTLNNAFQYMQKYKDKNLEYIGVAQGTTFEEISDCIRFYVGVLNLKTIALPYDLIKGADNLTTRYRFLKWWVKTEKTRVALYSPKFHLLGCENPAEFLLYKDSPEITRFIQSIDTSSPIVNGWHNIKFNEHGSIAPKPKDKIAENLDIQLSEEQIEVIMHNVKQFRKYVDYGA